MSNSTVFVSNACSNNMDCTYFEYSYFWFVVFLFI